MSVEQVNTSDEQLEARLCTMLQSIPNSSGLNSSC